MKKKITIVAALLILSVVLLGNIALYAQQANADYCGPLVRRTYVTIGGSTVTEWGRWCAGGAGLYWTTEPYSGCGDCH
jgi:hypothetical protein